MRRPIYLVLTLAVVAGLSAVAIGGVAGRTAGPTPADPSAAPASPVELLDLQIARTQDRLRRLPGDWESWAALGLRYLERARITTDPTYYPKAEQAVQRSLQVRASGNTPGLVARGALANARHDFAGARGDALAALALDAYSADAYAVLADALTQLGDRAGATDALQHLLDLRPGLPAYARASYDLELRGRTVEAADLMRRALDVAVDRSDVAFCRNQLGDLALSTGDLAAAKAEYDAGQDADPTSVTLLRGQSRLAAMTGDLSAAIAGYATLTQRAPAPGYLIEYADLLRAAGRDEQARAQLDLATAAYQLFVANGGADGLAAAQLAIATGDIGGAVQAAQAEWDRRQFVDVADVLGWALHLAHRDSDALRYAQAAVGTGAVSAGYAFHLGMIEAALGDRPAAIAQLNRALTINPAFSPVDAPAARAALSTLESR